MKIEQKHLFNQDNSTKRARIAWTGTVGDWFYIEHRDNPHQVIYADDKGNFYYGKRDLVRLVPVVWNLRRECNRVARHHGGRVKIYPYRLRT